MHPLRRWWPRLLVASVATSVATVGTVVMSAMPAGAQSVDVVSATVGPDARTDAHHSFFQLPLGPGDTLAQSVVVKNPNTSAMRVDVDAVTASTAAATGASYGAPGTKASGTAAWIELTEHQLQLAPGATRTVHFRVRVPSGTAPGQYLAGISISVPAPTSKPRNAQAPSQAGFALTLRAQRVIAVEIDVPGALAPRLEVRGARAEVVRDTFAVALDVANTGNAFAHGTGTLDVASTGTHREFPIDTFVGQTSVTMPIEWSRSAAVGDHAVEVRLAYDGGRVTKWSGTVTVDDALKTRLRQGVDTEAGIAPAPVASGSSFGLGDIALVVVVLCVLGAAAMHLRRRRLRSDAPHPSKPHPSKPGFARRFSVAVAAAPDDDVTSPVASPPQTVGAGRRE